MKIKELNNNAVILLAAVLLCLIGGCATQQKNVKSDYVFFPPPPDEPRIQFLTSFSMESDLGGQSKLSQFVVGQDKVLRPLWKPYGLTTSRGKLYICDTQPKNLTIVDFAKQKFDYLRPDGPAVMKMPLSIAVDPNDGTRYVADAARGQVLIYSADNQYLGDVGQKGEMKPSGIAEWKDRFYVTDLSNHCVRVYSKADRKLLFSVPRVNDDAHGKLYSPTNVDVDDKGQIYVSDTGAAMVQVYDVEGNLLRTIGQLGLKPGRFARPKGIAVDREGRVYVVDAATAITQVFDKEGRLLMYFGEPATSGPGALYLPAGIAVDYDNVDYFRKFAAPGYKIDFLIFVANQAGTQKVSVFGFMRKG